MARWWHLEGKRPLPSRQPRTAAAVERRRGAMISAARPACGYSCVVGGFIAIRICGVGVRINEMWGVS